MMNQLISTSAVVTALSLFAGGVLAAEPEPSQYKAQVQEQEKIYGSQLMTQQERNEHRKKMRTAKTAEEREEVRMKNHEVMSERAKSRGLTLPDEPPARGGGGGMGPGGGRGR